MKIAFQFPSNAVAVRSIGSNSTSDAAINGFNQLGFTVGPDDQNMDQLINENYSGPFPLSAIFLDAGNVEIPVEAVEFDGERPIRKDA